MNYYTKREALKLVEHYSRLIIGEKISEDLPYKITKLKLDEVGHGFDVVCLAETGKSADVYRTLKQVANYLNLQSPDDYLKGRN